MSKFTATIEVPQSHLESYELMLPYGEKELIEYGIPRLENIKTWTGKFSNGFEVDIKLNSSEDDVWTDGVLFDSKGNELCHTEVCDNIRGVWVFEVDGDKFEVELKGV